MWFNQQTSTSLIDLDKQTMLKLIKHSTHNITMSNQQLNQTDMPDGYVAIQGDDGQHYLVPHFMIPATHQVMEAYQRKVAFNVRNADGRVSFHLFHVHATSRPPHMVKALGQAKANAVWLMPCVMADAVGRGRCYVSWPMPCVVADAVTYCQHCLFPQ